MALTDPSQTAQTKADIVRDLLGGRATPTSAAVLEYSVGHLHGRRIDSVVDELCALAARQRERVVAEVRVAAPRTEPQQQLLADFNDWANISLAAVTNAGASPTGPEVITEQPEAVTTCFTRCSTTGSGNKSKAVGGV